MTGLVQNSADVRFREIDLSQTIRSVSSSIGAFVFASAKGRPGRYNITTPADFITEYGYPSASVSFGHYSALDALKQMGQIWCDRVVNSDALWSAGLLADNGSGTTVASSVSGGVSSPLTANIPWATIIAGPNIPIFVLTPKSGPGSWANTIAFRVRSDNLLPPAAPTAIPVTGTGALGAATYTYKLTVTGKQGETMASATVSPVLSSTGQIVLSWPLVEGAIAYNIYGRTGGTLFLIIQLGAGTTTWTDNGTISPTSTQSPASPPPTTTNFDLWTYDTTISTSTPQLIQTVTLQDEIDAQGQQLQITQKVNAFNPYVNVASNVPSLVSVPTIHSTVGLTYLAGGASGTAPTIFQIAADWTNQFSHQSAVQANILVNGGYSTPTVQQAMDAAAQTRGDATTILDVPSTNQDFQSAIDYRNNTLNLNSSYSALYTPDLLESDNYNGKVLYIPPSGAVAAVYALTDNIAGPQFAPAGLNRGQLNVQGIRPQSNGRQYNDAERTSLFQAQVNYSRTFLGLGTAVFEQVTLQAKQSALSWVNVRRMINVIKISLKNFLVYDLHEPNDDFLRKLIVQSISDYLQSWKDARGIIDFLVIADKTNNPPNLYNLGILKISVFITPVIAVHEIQTDIIITKVGVAFSEINIQNLG